MLICQHREDDTLILSNITSNPRLHPLHYMLAIFSLASHSGKQNKDLYNIIFKKH